MAIGELFVYRLSRCSETEDWAIDTEAALSAQVGAALRISHALAGSQVRYARAMRERLPLTAAVFVAGDIGYRVFRTLVYRTDLITDAQVLAGVDARLAANVARWPSMTSKRLAAQVDKIVAAVDADALRRRRQHQQDREIVIEDYLEGISEIHGRLSTVDAHFDGGPGEFQGQPLLGIHIFGFAVGYPEKRRIEAQPILKVSAVAQCRTTIQIAKSRLT